MPYPLNNAGTANAYATDPRAATACSVIFPARTQQAFFFVAANGSVAYRVTYKTQGVREAVQPEKFLPPGKGVFGPPIDFPERADLIMIEFRSWVAGVQTFVTCS